MNPRHACCDLNSSQLHWPERLRLTSVTYTRDHAGWKAPKSVISYCSGLYPLGSWKNTGWRKTAQPLSLGSFFQCWTTVMVKKFLLTVQTSLLKSHACCLSPSVKSLAPSSGWPLVRCLGLLFRLPKADFSVDWPSLPPHRARTSVTNRCGGTTLKSLQLVNRYLVPLKCLSRHTKLTDMKWDL